MDRRIGILYGHSVSQSRIAQNCINKTINNIVLDVIGSRLANNHIIMIRQESKLLRPIKTIIARLNYNILLTINLRPERQFTFII